MKKAPDFSRAFYLACKVNSAANAECINKVEIVKEIYAPVRVEIRGWSIATERVYEVEVVEEVDSAIAVEVCRTNRGSGGITVHVSATGRHNTAFFPVGCKGAGSADITDREGRGIRRLSDELN